VSTPFARGPISSPGERFRQTTSASISGSWRSVAEKRILASLHLRAVQGEVRSVKSLDWAEPQTNLGHMA
jgi:hypothetical protein